MFSACRLMSWVVVMFDRCLWLVGCRVLFVVSYVLPVVCCVSCVVVVC